MSFPGRSSRSFVSVISDASSEQLVAWIERGNMGTGCRMWTLDPIDGTKGFLGGRQYVLALALIVDGVVQLAVIGCPRLSLVPVPGGDVRIDEQAFERRYSDRGPWSRSMVERSWGADLAPAGSLSMS